MNNNQTTADTTAEETTVATPATETTTTTTEATTATTSTSEEGDGGVTTTDYTDGIYNYDSTTVSGPFTLGETFTATNSTLTVESGDTFTANKVNSSIALSNNKITNNDATSAFLRATESDIVLKLTGQVAEGDIVLDAASTMNLILNGSSFYMGSINPGNLAKSVSITLDASSQLILAGDTYVTTLTNAEPTNMNIYGNGYKLYVAGAEVAVNGSEAPEAPEVKVEEEPVKEEATEVIASETTTAKSTSAQTDYTPFIVGGAAILVIILAVVAFAIHNKKKNTPTGTVMGAPDAASPAPMDGARPDFSQFDDGPVAQPQPQPQPPVQPTAPETPAGPQPAEPTNGSPINPFHPNN